MTALQRDLNDLREAIGNPEPLDWHIPLLDDAQFTNDDVLSVTGLASTQLHNWVSRGWVLTGNETKPGRGKRRLFSGCDVIAINIVQELAPFGLIKAATQMTSPLGWICPRAHDLVSARANDVGKKTFIIGAGEDIAYFHDDRHIPVDNHSVLIIATDNLIIKTLQRLYRVTVNIELPILARFYPPSTEETQSYIDDFFSVWDTDNHGEKVRTGLTFEETREIEPWFDLEKESGTPIISMNLNSRISSLLQKHVLAAEAKRVIIS